MVQATLTLWQREIVRFYRQPSRIAGAIGSPFVFWLLIGSGIGASFQGGAEVKGMNYATYFFPGTLMLIVLFTAIFSTISIIEDRREGFLQSVLVAPVSRTSIVLGKVLGGSTLALMQAVIFLVLAPCVGISLSITSGMAVLFVLLMNAFVLTSLGFVLAWQFRSVQGFHAVMNLFLFPMWILSGALFPAEGASGWIQAAMKANPLTYGMTSLRLAFFGQGSWGSPLLLMLGFGLLLFLFAVWRASKKEVS
jgi:ABC-2 type transport system permease protein